MILLKRRCVVGLTRVNLRGIRVSRTASGGEPAPSFRRNRPFVRASPHVFTLSSRLSHRYYPRFARPREGNGKRTKQTDRNIARERREEKQANTTRRTNEKKRKEKKRKEKNFATARRMSSESQARVCLPRSFRRRLRNDLRTNATEFLSSSSLDAEKPKNRERERAPSFFYISSCTERTETDELRKKKDSLSSAIVPTTPSERSQMYRLFIIIARRRENDQRSRGARRTRTKNVYTKALFCLAYFFLRFFFLSFERLFSLGRDKRQKLETKKNLKKKIGEKIGEKKAFKKNRHFYYPLDFEARTRIERYRKGGKRRRERERERERREEGRFILFPEREREKGAERTP